ncbi:WD40/YVTN/BNR-like repeat-containing protein [Rosettibacter firmus]|uniref:WD40/YVTN/BNR-like repeat-containing protein n=1 Tax=Rosettibacter firmus TaxID=3111522 RepID=UPI00336C1586
MKRLLIVLFFGSLTINLFSQNLPKSFSFTSDSETINDFPASNSIERILFVEDTIWIATSKGLSKSTDYGNTWINFYRHKDFGEDGVSAIGYYNGTVWAATWKMDNIAGSSVPTGTGLHYSTDFGKTWNNIKQPVDDPSDSIITYGINKIRALPVTVPQQNFVYDIAFTKNTIWIVCFAGGLRKSTDMGKTWQRVVLPPDNLDSIKPTDTLKFSLQPVAGKFGKESYLNHRAFSLLTVDDTTIYVGTAGGINKSTDGGISWIKFNHTNQEQPISGNFILSIQHNKFDNSIWAATWKAEGLDEYYALSSSNDGGKTWKTFLTNEKILDIDFKYYGDANNYTHADIFAATENGLFRSNNSGKSWLAVQEIIDSKTGLPINIKNQRYRAVKVKQKESVTDIWIGTLDGLVKFTDINNNWDGEWKVFLSSKKLNTSNDSYAFPNPFSPDEEVVRIKYKIEKSANVTIRIFDFGMNLVRTLIQNVNKTLKGEQIEFWDGKDENGKIVPNGVYFYRIDIDSNEPLFGKIIVLM